LRTFRPEHYVKTCGVASRRFASARGTIGSQLDAHRGGIGRRTCDGTGGVERLHPHAALCWREEWTGHWLNAIPDAASLRAPAEIPRGAASIEGEPRPSSERNRCAHYDAGRARGSTGEAHGTLIRPCRHPWRRGATRLPPDLAHGGPLFDECGEAIAIYAPEG
jgi:hypothetical protein